MNTIIIAAGSVTVIGIICAAALSVASKLMAVKIDERIAKILGFLPGTNCGACGFPGCEGYAAALVSDTGVKGNLCTPGGALVSEQISEILGVKAEIVARKYAVVRCKGDSNTQLKKMDYKGIQSCKAAKQLYSGEGACAFGCLGYGDCVIVCPSGAVCLENSLARIDTRKCNGCSLCVKVCPNNIISIENAGTSVFILCKNLEKGAQIRKKCSNGCIGCGICAKECPAEAIIIEDNLAIIDYKKCTNCNKCAEICVTKCIQSVIIPNI
ncbi:MAG: RnfABCDGE type electron transport complex subunit B [Treponema sp.]|jgi:RnfABCDGE-type electron transport complex B subunit|nr:RnfABCDGE type electron transport complex subunit B [Treponema sp.]